MTTSATQVAAVNNNNKNNNNNSTLNNNTASAAATPISGGNNPHIAMLQLTPTTTTTSNGTSAVIPIPVTTITTPASTNNSAATTRAMQSDEDFNIRFVNLVRTHKCLYDKKVPEYRNRDNQEKAWSLISLETKESVIHCKERWRNLRACLSRYIKQQSSADPQHKPYYLTEHMAFLLPFLKSTRTSLDSNNGSNSLSAFLQISQQRIKQIESTNGGSLPMVIAPVQLPFGEQKLEMKHSLSDNEDEETIDAFDPAVAASMHAAHSPPLSDTASANSMQNFIPDVQLAELRTPEPSAQDISYVTAGQNHHGSGGSMRHDAHDFVHEPKRIKTECGEATTTATMHMYSENTDMEFFRSILSDIAALTPQQKRKFKIGVLELIDDVVERFPAERGSASGSNNNLNNSTATSLLQNNCSSSSNKSRRNSSREWRK